MDGDDSHGEMTTLQRPAVVGKSAKYYYSPITVQVEDNLFRVPRQAFETQSEVFADMFSVPTSHEEGDSDENPIYLAGITKTVFTDFLEVLYPRTLFNASELKWSYARWLAVLDLAHMWDFKDIKKLAISRLEKINFPSEIIKIAITHKYQILEWRLPAYEALAKRKEPLAVDEAAQLGYEFSAKMAQVRERKLERKIARKTEVSSTMGPESDWTSSPRRRGLVGTKEDLDDGCLRQDIKTTFDI